MMSAVGKQQRITNKVREYLSRNRATSAMELRYRASIDDDGYPIAITLSQMSALGWE